MDVNKMQGLINGIKQIREGVIDGAMSPEDAAALNREGVDEYRSGNYEKAYELFYEAAENGDAWGMYNVADMYKELEFYSFLKDINISKPITKVNTDVKVNIVSDINEVIVDKKVAIYIELTESNYHNGDLYGLSIYDGKNGYFINKEQHKKYVPKPYDIYWKVKHRGEVAECRSC